MEEKWEDIFKQYDFEVKRILWARGAKLLETNQGLFQMKQFNGKPRQLALEDAITSGLEKNGCFSDSILKTKEGTLFTLGTSKKMARNGKFCKKEEEDNGEQQETKETETHQEWWDIPFPEGQDVYVIRKWFPGEEGNFRSMEFLKRAAASLGKLHNAMENLEISEKLLVFHSSMHLLEHWQKHNRELKRIRRYILNKKQKNEFEVLFLSMEKEYMETAQRAYALLEEEGNRKLFSEAAARRLFCHGNYNYHNLLDTRIGIVTVCFEDAGIGLPVFDLYQMVRKLLEKNRWDQELLSAVIKEYEGQRKLTDKEKQLLYIMLLYPEKFWKVSNHYYNSRKSWINQIDIAKLEELGRQQQRRQETLEYFKQHI